MPPSTMQGEGRSSPVLEGEVGGENHTKASRKDHGAEDVAFGEAAAPARGFPRNHTQTPDPAARQHKTTDSAAKDHRRPRSSRDQSFFKGPGRLQGAVTTPSIATSMLPAQPWEAPHQQSPSRPSHAPLAGAAAFHLMRRRQIPYLPRATRTDHHVVGIERRTDHPVVEIKS